MALLKQSTAYTRMFLVVQTADHLTGLTGASPTVTVSKAGGAFGAAGGTVTEVSSGFYKIALTTTDTNTVGDLAYHITATSGDATDFVDQITAAVDQTGDNFARLGAPAGASVSADVAAINSKTTNLPASPSAVGSAMTLTSGERNSVADALLDRDMSTGADSGSTTVRTVRNALRFLRNKWSISGTTMTVCKEDDTTTAWTATLTATAGANPVTASDPAG